MPLPPLQPSEISIATSNALNAAVNVAPNGANPSIEILTEAAVGALNVTAGAQGGDPKLYTFVEYTCSNKIMLCYNEFETGLEGHPSVNLMEQKNGTKWREWQMGTKWVNKMTKTFLLQQQIYNHVKCMVTATGRTIIEIATQLQSEMDSLVGTNKKRGLDFYSDHLKHDARVEE
ncbi:hypothetical protein BJ741DRAFT_597100 [Chytriomyces cf. hyalinus JEL632]|nr:hypothetical protein BJ741DRAFT_597100 [Chytriomyces cf. hyalinus JEL632]